MRNFRRSPLSLLSWWFLRLRLFLAMPFLCGNSDDGPRRGSVVSNGVVQTPILELWI